MISFMSCWANFLLWCYKSTKTYVDSTQKDRLVSWYHLCLVEPTFCYDAINQPKHTLMVLERTVSSRRSFWVPPRYMLWFRNKRKRIVEIRLLIWNFYRHFSMKNWVCCSDSFMYWWYMYLKGPSHRDGSFGYQQRLLWYIWVVIYNFAFLSGVQ